MGDLRPQEALQAHLRTVGTGNLGTLAEDHPCEGAAHHSPTPITVQRLRFTDTEGAWLCPTCMANVRVYVALVQFGNGFLDWPVRRCFGNQLRAIADRALGAAR